MHAVFLNILNQFSRLWRYWATHW